MNKNIINKLEYGINKQKFVTFNFTECNWLLMLLKENKELQDRIDKAIEYMEHYIEVEDAPINERIKIEFEYVIDILRGEKDE